MERVPARTVVRIGQTVTMDKAENIRQARKDSWRKRFPLLDIGNGPWAVLENCPAERHNTYAAGRGYARGTTQFGVKCVCPRALAAVEEYNRTRRRSDKPRGEEGVIERRETTWAMVDASIVRAEYYNNIKPAPVPDLRAGLCRSDAGMKIMDEAASITTRSTSRELGVTLRAKQLCEGCPVRQLCLADVQRRESPGGAWGGVFAGLTPIERRRDYEGRVQ